MSRSRDLGEPMAAGEAVKMDAADYEHGNRHSTTDSSKSDNSRRRHPKRSRLTSVASGRGEEEFSNKFASQNPHTIEMRLGDT
ncbi:hypothetical protein JTE90_018148 [Oedothorax gibbosus]|uniref:Uncharacterized protein n=1 Tax=Oedothorax gibbosus TaxID=931172 RepID=A0AAV6TLK9_9ARAC|nr:hypothetical protein JTE90_018148 [Oedothorax gibbosus]